MLGKKSIAVMALWGVLLGGASLAAGSNRQKAVEALNAKNYEKAIAILKKEAARGKENEQFWNLCRLGSAYYLSKQIPEAIATLVEALKHLGRASAADALETSACYFYLGQAQNDSQRYQEAAASFSNGASFELRISRGQSDAGERAKNEQSAAGLLAWQGASLLWSGKYQDAADAFQKAIRLNPKRADIYMGLAAASVRIKQYDEALAAV
ncbi:MAG: tetratricopeptide repeat protein, partial [Acidobacteriota bacterium]